MQITAAVVPAQSADFEIQTLDIEDPRANEIRVKLVATGVCHTDAFIREGGYPTNFPVVLGHEGAGVVESVGDAVTSVKPGDRVVLGFNSCGHCDNCLSGKPAYCLEFNAQNFGGGRVDGTSALSRDGERIDSNFFGQSSFATYAIATERNVVKVDEDAPLELLGPLGCGLSTGAGAIINSLKVNAGATVGVFGTGAVGSAAIMAAAAIGATTIIALDLNDDRLALAKELGATHSINSGKEDVAARVAEITGGRGLDFVLDTTGVPAVTSSAAPLLAVKGTLGLVGAAKPGAEVSFEVGGSLIKGWSFKTIIEGDAVPQDFIPRLVHLWRQGKFPIEKISKTFPFEQINEAFEASKSGEVIKPVLVFEQ